MKLHLIFIALIFFLSRAIRVVVYLIGAALMLLVIRDCTSDAWFATACAVVLVASLARVYEKMD